MVSNDILHMQMIDQRIQLNVLILRWRQSLHKHLSKELQTMHISIQQTSSLEKVLKPFYKVKATVTQLRILMVFNLLKSYSIGSRSVLVH